MSTGNPVHVSSRHIVGVAWFYKLLSLFHPLYLTLFAALCLYPRQLASPTSPEEQTVLMSVALGLSGIYFLWIRTSGTRCRELLEWAFRARRISTLRPWPMFPNELHLLGTRTEDRGLRYIGNSLKSLSAILTALNLYVLLTNAIWPPGDPWGFGRTEWRGWRTGLTLLVFFALFAYVHLRTERRLEIARALDPVHGDPWKPSQERRAKRRRLANKVRPGEPDQRKGWHRFRDWIDRRVPEDRGVLFLLYFRIRRRVGLWMVSQLK